MNITDTNTYSIKSIISGKYITANGDCGDKYTIITLCDNTDNFEFTLDKTSCVNLIEFFNLKRLT